MKHLTADYDKLTWEERRKLREAYVEAQGGRCYHCGGLLREEPPPEIMSKGINLKLFPHGFFDHAVHLHHRHDTGATVGAVHSYCNAVLWQYYGE